MKRAALPIAVALLLAASPARAQEPDAARLAVAERIVKQIFPAGTYRRMMDGTMNQIIDATMGSMSGMKVGDLARAGGADAETVAAAGDKTMGEALEEADPHHKERMRITMDVMMDEMVTLMTEAEPEIQQGLARVYARRFTPQQLGELATFFETPTGRAYADQYMMVFTDPDLMATMQGFSTRLMTGMPAILEKVKAATAHLPPPPRPDTTGN